MNSIVTFIADLNDAKFLIEHGANINATDDDGNTPLHISILFRKIHLIKLSVYSMK